jgi:hypothetical protein
MLRVCRLITEPGQTFGFELAQEDNKHIIRNVKPDSAAGKMSRYLFIFKKEIFFLILARAGLHNEDRLIEVNDENVTQRLHRGIKKLFNFFFLYFLFSFKMLLL